MNVDFQNLSKHCETYAMIGNLLCSKSFGEKRDIECHCLTDISSDNLKGNLIPNYSWNEISIEETITKHPFLFLLSKITR